MMDCPLGRSTHLACISSSPCLSSLGLPRLSPACGTAHHHRPLATRFANRVQTRAPPPVGLHRPLHEPPAQTSPRFWARRAHCSVRHRPTVGAPPGTPRRTLPVRAPAPGQRGPEKTFSCNSCPGESAARDSANQFPGAKAAHPGDTRPEDAPGREHGSGLCRELRREEGGAAPRLPPVRPQHHRDPRSP